MLSWQKLELGSKIASRIVIVRKAPSSHSVSAEYTLSVSRPAHWWTEMHQYCVCVIFMISSNSQIVRRWIETFRTATFPSPSGAYPWAPKRPAKRAMRYVARTLNILFYHRFYSSSIRDLLLWLYRGSRNRLFLWLYPSIWRALLLISIFDGLHSCKRHACSWVYSKSTHHLCPKKTLEAIFPIASWGRLCFCVRPNFLHIASKCCTESTV